jgi:transposase-like protein
MTPPITITEERAAAAAVVWDDPEWFRDLERTEELCRAYVEQLRWPDGVACPRCDSDRICRLATRRRFNCRCCRYQFSVTSGTLFHRSRVPLWKWFLTISLLLGAEDGVPANQLVKLIGGSYKTAWFLEHRVRAALAGGPCRSRSDEGSGRCERLFDRDIVGCYHQHGVKYLEAYAAEREWRSRNRRNPDGFRDAALALIDGEPLEYAALVGG